jgi:hypothetical protein
MSTRNLLDETVAFLARHGHTPDNVQWVGSIGGSYGCTWDEFVPLANREYDAGYGGAEVSQNLVVVGHDWWLERHEYDGSEWWEYKSRPMLMPAPRKTPTNVFIDDCYNDPLE